MKVEINGQQLHPRRGGPVEIGNVYGNAYGKPFFRLVVGVMARAGDRPWRNIVCLRLDTSGNIVGCATEPEAYVAEHQDLIGKVREMPNMKIDWFREPVDAVGSSGERGK